MGSTAGSLAWAAASFAFVGWLWWYLGGLEDSPVADAKALEFVTGYLVEKALAVDNIFVFLMVSTCFAVPAEYQKRALMIGSLGALVLRAIMILVGAWLITRFHWIATGQEPDLEVNPARRWIRGRMRITPDYDGGKFFTVRAGVGMATPLFVVILLIDSVDVYKIPVTWSLGFTVAVLAGTMILSLSIPPKGKPRAAYPFAARREPAEDEPRR